jgi:hypothetical protein
MREVDDYDWDFLVLHYKYQTDKLKLAFFWHFILKTQRIFSIKTLILI